MAVDRRICKTKESLKNALIALLNEKEINNITVKELCIKADINRSTFYSHYKDQNDLYNSILNQLFQNMELYLKKSINIDFDNRASAITFLSRIFTYCRNNSEYTAVFLVSQRKNIVCEQISNFFKRYNIYSRNCRLEINEVFEHYYYTYVSVGIIAVVQSWMENGMKQSDEEMANIVFDLVNSQK
ncbi:MAG TPA: hypothetical protein DDY98_00160 [Ruminococcaceae bacterium]|nr:hypothetical protein [Oscillospiraceae bacterium]